MRREIVHPIKLPPQRKYRNKDQWPDIFPYDTSTLYLLQQVPTIFLDLLDLMAILLRLRQILNCSPRFTLLFFTSRSLSTSLELCSESSSMLSFFSIGGRVLFFTIAVFPPTSDLTPVLGDLCVNVMEADTASPSTSFDSHRNLCRSELCRSSLPPGTTKTGGGEATDCCCCC